MHTAPRMCARRGEHAFACCNMLQPIAPPYARWHGEARARTIPMNQSGERMHDGIIVPALPASQDQGSGSSEEKFVIGDELPDAPGSAQRLLLPKKYGISPVATMHRRLESQPDGSRQWNWQTFAHAPLLV